MEEMGHVVHLDISDRLTTMKRLTKVVLDTEKRQRTEDDNVMTFSNEEHLAFMNKWKADNYDKLVFELGAVNDHFEFLNGIMFATSASM